MPYMQQLELRLRAMSWRVRALRMGVDPDVLVYMCLLLVLHAAQKHAFDL